MDFDFDPAITFDELIEHALETQSEKRTARIWHIQMGFEVMVGVKAIPEQDNVYLAIQ
ncbi:hypothetical protein [Roseivirga pacifica]|uniref:hypothetical protein n=1 Tax=Roseivirga pacifica TaxID=1267423 RepID=UPI003BAC9AEC